MKNKFIIILLRDGKQPKTGFHMAVDIYGMFKKKISHGYRQPSGCGILKTPN
jgi:hypothetical protein